MILPFPYRIVKFLACLYEGVVPKTKRILLELLPNKEICNSPHRSSANHNINQSNPMPPKGKKKVQAARDPPAAAAAAPPPVG